MSKGLYQRLQAFEKEHGVVVHYGNSRGNQSTRPMTALVIHSISTSPIYPALKQFNLIIMDYTIFRYTIFR